MELKMYMEILARHWKIVLVVATIVICLAIVGSQFYLPRYQAVAMLRIVTPLIGSPDNINYQTTFATRVLNTYAQIAVSEQMRNDLKKNLGLQILPAIAVDVITDSEILQITVESEDPELSASAANELSNLLVSYQDNMPNESDSELNVLSNRQKELQNELAQYQSQYDQMVQNYSQTAAEMTVLEGTIRLKEISYQTLRLQSQIDQAEKDLAALNEKYSDLSTKSNEYMQQITLTRQMIQETQSAYMNLLSQYDNVSLSTLRRQNAQSIEFVSLAAEPTAASGPSRLMIQVLGVILGLIAGVITAFTVDNLDTRIFSTKQFLAVTRVPILGEIPKFSRQKDNGSEQALLLQRCYLLLSARLKTLVKSESIKTIMVTSPRKGEGKSTLVKQLAIDLARNKCKVLVVDADLRRPQQHRLFQANAKYGLNDFLTDNTKKPNDVILKDIETRLDLVPSLVEVDHSIELWHSPRWDDLFESVVVYDYDIVLLDTPAFLGSSDSLHLAEAVDGVLVTVQWGYTTTSDIKALCDQLESIGSKALGIVVNQLPLQKVS